MFTPPRAGWELPCARRLRTGRVRSDAHSCSANQSCYPQPQQTQRSVRREPLQTAGRTLAQQLPRHEREIESAHVNQGTLENILSSPQVGTPHASRLIGMRKAAFQKLPAPSQQLFSVFAANTSSVVVNRLLCFGLVLPTAASTIGLGNVCPNSTSRSACSVALL